MTVKEKFEIKLQEYKDKYIQAKSIVDRQENFDTSLQAEVEDELLILANRELNAVLDVYIYVFGEK